eukprot:scaffold289912_cov28-Tisochrysis_lutea.AAC.3
MLACLVRNLKLSAATPEPGAADQFETSESVRCDEWWGAIRTSHHSHKTAGKVGSLSLSLSPSKPSCRQFVKSIWIDA